LPSEGMLLLLLLLLLSVTSCTAGDVTAAAAF
jgi:hypothetical protein